MKKDFFLQDENTGMEVEYPTFVWDEKGNAYFLLAEHFPLLYLISLIHFPKQKGFVFEKKENSSYFLFETKKSFDDKNPIESGKIASWWCSCQKIDFKQKKLSSGDVISVLKTKGCSPYLTIYEEKKDVFSWILMKEEIFSCIVKINDAVYLGNHVMIFAKCSGRYADVIVMRIEKKKVVSSFMFTENILGIYRETIKKIFYYIEPHLTEKNESEVLNQFTSADRQSNINFLKLGYREFLCAPPYYKNSNLCIFEGLTKIIEMPNRRKKNVEKEIISYFAEREKKRLLNFGNGNEYLEWISRKIIRR